MAQRIGCTMRRCDVHPCLPHAGPAALPGVLTFLLRFSLSNSPSAAFHSLLSLPMLNNPLERTSRRAQLYVSARSHDV